GKDVYDQYLFGGLSDHKWDVKWTDPKSLEALLLLKELSDNYFAPGALGQEVSQARALVTTTGEAAMNLVENWETPDVVKEAEDSGIELGIIIFSTYLK
ncbi:unnamed protein product, partial [marine sediment metagenome]